MQSYVKSRVEQKKLACFLSLFIFQPTASFNCCKAISNTLRGQPTLRRMKPSPSFPNIVPSFSAK